MPKLYILSGPKIGQSFELRDGTNFIGRSMDNDIQIEDETVSRKHIRIVRRDDQYFITDLSSRNGTFFDGDYLGPGDEVEIKEGVPVAIGMTVICLGEQCREEIIPFLGTTELYRGRGNENEVLSGHTMRRSQNESQFLNKVCGVFKKDLPLVQALGKILEHILDLFNRIDRASAILIDHETEEITQIISRSRKPETDHIKVYCEGVVSWVIKERKPLVIFDAQREKDEVLADTLKLSKIKSVVCVPLLAASQVVGVIYVDSQEKTYGFRKNDVAIFLDVSRRIATVIRNLQFASELSKIADSLSIESQ